MSAPLPSSGGRGWHHLRLCVYLNAYVWHNEVETVRVKVSGHNSQVLYIVEKIHGSFRLEGTVSVSQQNCKHPRAYTILEVPINEISLGRLN